MCVMPVPRSRACSPRGLSPRSRTALYPFSFLISSTSFAVTSTPSCITLTSPGISASIFFACAGDLQSCQVTQRAMSEMKKCCTQRCTFQISSFGLLFFFTDELHFHAMLREQFGETLLPFDFGDYHIVVYAY